MAFEVTTILGMGRVVYISERRNTKQLINSEAAFIATILLSEEDIYYILSHADIWRQKVL